MIKKSIFLLLFSAFCGVSLNAQKKKFEPEWNIGVGFGPTFSSVDFQRAEQTERLRTKNTQQYFGGISVKYISEKNLGFIAELNYSQQGWEQLFQDHPEYEHSHQLNYLEMPILTHIYFGNKVRFIINLGPKIGFLISDSEKMNDALLDYLGSGNYPPSEVTYQYYHMADKKIDYGIMGGLGLEFKTGIGSFVLEGRYSFGLGDIYNNKKSDFFSRSANRVVSAKLTYYVKLF